MSREIQEYQAGGDHLEKMYDSNMLYSKKFGKGFYLVNFSEVAELIPQQPGIVKACVPVYIIMILNNKFQETHLISFLLAMCFEWHYYS